MSNSAMAMALRQKLDEAALGRFASGEAVEDYLVQLWKEGGEVWPSLQPSAEVFVTLVANRLNQGMDRSELSASEMYIAAACASLESEPVRLLEENFFHGLWKRLSSMRLSEELRDEVSQTVREKLFVAKEGEYPRICKYAGLGRLSALVEVTGYRAALSLVQKNGEHERAGQDALLEIPTAAADPALANIRHQFADAFRAAFSTAMASRSSRERTLLRLRYVDGLSVEQISSLYQVHRTTGSRWFSNIRDNLLQETKAELGRSVDPSHLSSLLKLVDSQMDVSIEKLLRSAPEGR